MKIYQILIFLITLSSFSQNCNCDGFLDWRSDKTINVYSDSKGEDKISEFQNDIVNEDFIGIHILDSNVEYFKVNLTYLMSNREITGWIKKVDNIVTLVGRYSKDYNIELFKKPDDKSELSTELIRSIPQFFTIIDCKNDWLLVRLKDGDNIYQGWIGPRMHCPNPYSTCG